MHLKTKNYFISRALRFHLSINTSDPEKRKLLFHFEITEKSMCRKMAAYNIKQLVKTVAIELFIGQSG